MKKRQSKTDYRRESKHPVLYSRGWSIGIHTVHAESCLIQFHASFSLDHIGSSCDGGWRGNHGRRGENKQTCGKNMAEGNKQERSAERENEGRLFSSWSREIL